MVDIFEEQAKKLDFHGIIITSIITALSFVVALFWRDAISLTVSQIFPETHEITSKYVVAMIFTFIAAGASFILLKSQEIKIHKLVTLQVKTKEKEKEKNKESMNQELQEEIKKLLSKVSKYQSFKYNYKPEKKRLGVL